MNPYKFETGDLIKARVKKWPFIFTYGFVVLDNGRPTVWHNTPNEKNEAGGNIVVHDLDTWTRSRTIVSVKKTNVSESRIREVSNDKINKPFNLLTWNCEHYVFLIRDKAHRSPQLSAFIWYAGILLFILTTKYRKLLKSPASFALGTLFIVSTMATKPRSLVDD